MFIFETENMIKLSSHNRSCWNADHADCRLHTADCTLQTECYFFTCTFSKLCQVKWLKIKPFSASYNGYERNIIFLNFLDCWWSSLVSLCNSNRWLAVISSNLTDTDVIVVIVVYLPKNKYSDFHVFGGSVSVRITRRRAATWNFSQIILNEN